LLESSGGDVRLVQEVLGHASLQTLQVYTNFTDKRKAAAYKRFGTFLCEKDAGPGPMKEPRTRE
jgi:integrase